MFERIWQQLSRVTLGSCAALLLVASTASADDAAKDREIQELKDRQEQQAKQIESLQRMLQNQRINISTESVEQIVTEQLKAQEAKKAEEEAKKKKEAEAKGYEVGSDLKMSASWNNGLVLESAQKDFRIQAGGYLQADAVWFKQPQNLRGAPPGGNLGVPGTTGIGIFDDGTFLRRVRWQFDGQAWENWEFNMTFQGENVLRGVTFDEMWMGVKDLPVLGSVRA